MQSKYGKCTSTQPLPSTLAITCVFFVQHTERSKKWIQTATEFPASLQYKFFSKCYSLKNIFLTLKKKHNYTEYHYMGESMHKSKCKMCCIICAGWGRLQHLIRCTPFTTGVLMWQKRQHSVCSHLHACLPSAGASQGLLFLILWTILQTLMSIALQL